MNALAWPMPCSKIGSTSLSPGPSSHWSNHASMPLARSRIAKPSANRSLSAAA